MFTSRGERRRKDEMDEYKGGKQTFYTILTPEFPIYLCRKTGNREAERKTPEETL